jgi:hypothetical protein
MQVATINTQNQVAILIFDLYILCLWSESGFALISFSSTISIYSDGILDSSKSFSENYHRSLCTSVAEPHHFYAAPAPGKNFDAAPAPTLLHSKTKFLKRTKV